MDIPGLPYGVEDWMDTEKFIRTLEEKFEGFRPTPNQKLHLADILGRLVPNELADAAIRTRESGWGPTPVLSQVRRHLGVGQDSVTTKRMAWVAVILSGQFYD